MNRPIRPGRAARTAVVGAAALLAACAHTPPTRFFTLDPAPAGAGAPPPVYAGPPVRVLAVNLPPEMDRPELVSRRGGDQLGVDDFAHWAAPVGELARTALAADLAARLPQGRVVFPGAARLEPSRDLTVSVLDFEVAGGQATIDASWTLATAGGRPAPGQATGGTLRLTAPAAGVGSAATARALSALLASLADRLAATLEAGA
jgi:uncharacterized lipoprotein YmbA